MQPLSNGELPPAMRATVRQRAVRLLAEARPQSLGLCREVEAQAHAAATTADEYRDHVQRATFQLRANPRLSDAHAVVTAPDEVLVEGTLLARIQAERAAREERFQRMLQDKYEALQDDSLHALVRCRRCGGGEVTWEEKQTRSADEAATLFCVCTTCKNRWVMR